MPLRDGNTFLLSVAVRLIIPPRHRRWTSGTTRVITVPETIVKHPVTVDPGTSRLSAVVLDPIIVDVSYLGEFYGVTGHCKISTRLLLTSAIGLGVVKLLINQEIVGKLLSK